MTRRKLFTALFSAPALPSGGTTPAPSSQKTVAVRLAASYECLGCGHQLLFHRDRTKMHCASKTCLNYGKVITLHTHVVDAAIIGQADQPGFAGTGTRSCVR
jgi:hypothetical protein